MVFGNGMIFGACHSLYSGGFPHSETQRKKGAAARRPDAACEVHMFQIRRFRETDAEAVSDLIPKSRILVTRLQGE